MKFIADFHVHSKFSRATAKNLDLENLYIAAQIKGVTVVGTGDFTYPQWFSEIGDKLQTAEPGLFKLKEEHARICDQQVPSSCRAEVRFILSTEISNIYKKNEKTRKNHNLILVPDLAVAEKVNSKLDSIGNIKSDGRPILGLDARDLLEILLETSDEGYLIPAHIWTPWFSVLGSKSGFDSIEECFEDLTPNIFAVETGLSSDPPMNWRVSGLDGLTLVSNSDAHSPQNLGREANLLNTDLSFNGIKSAIKSGDADRFLGTFEFYPEEGKYHLDGHRNCKIRLHPKETMNCNGKCPVCGKELTIGVLYRVEELADRGQNQRPPNSHSYYNIVQLTNILAEIFQVGAKSKKVLKNYQTAINELGSEFTILHSLEPDVIDRAGIPLLGEAIRRMRNHEIEVLPGYDGEYGQVKIFRADERELLTGQKALFSMPAPAPIKPESVTDCVASFPKKLPFEPETISKLPSGNMKCKPVSLRGIDQIKQYKADMSSMTVADRLLYLEKNTKLSSMLNKDTTTREAFVGLVELARQFNTRTAEFLAAIALHTDTDAYALRVEKVSFMTMHAAKGLEFAVVFIAGCEQDYIPYKRYDHEQVDIAEERRLFYVAMTRAMERLYLTRAKERLIFGKSEPRARSPFVADIENRLKKDETPQQKKKKERVEQKQLKLF